MHRTHPQSTRQIKLDLSYEDFRLRFEPQGEVLSTKVLPHLKWEHIVYRRVERYRRRDDHSDVVVVSVDFPTDDRAILNRVYILDRYKLEKFLEHRRDEGEMELRFCLLLMNSPEDTPGLLKPLEIISDTGHSFRMKSKSYKIVYPYATAGSLDDYLQKGKRLSKEEFLRLIVDTALGVEFMNTHFIVSGDLTPKNLYGFTDGNGNLKWRWGDWEKVWYNNAHLTNRGQWKTAYAPLELHNSGSSITTAVDIFMLATTWLYVDTRSNIEDLAQEKAEQKDTSSDSYSRVLTPNPFKYFKGFRFFDSKSQEFLSRMLEKDVSIRPEIDEVVEFVRELWKCSANDKPSTRDTKLLVPETKVFQNFYELRKESEWTGVEKTPFYYWVLELKAVDSAVLKRIIIDNKIFGTHHPLMKDVKAVVEAEEFMLIQVKLARQAASSSALAVYQGNVGTAKSLCLRADECAKLFELDRTNIRKFIRRQADQVRKRKAKSDSNWLINRAMPLKTKEAIMDFTSKTLHDMKIPHPHTNYQAWVRLDLVELFIREYEDYTKAIKTK